MAKASASVERRMSVAEFLAWSEGFGNEERYELVRGEPLRLMALTIIRHARVQRNVADAVRRALAARGLRCEVFENGPGMAIGLEGDECRIPDVVVTCAAEIDELARLVPETLIVVEVASPSTRLGDVNDKVEFYERIRSIQHYRVVEQDQRRMVHYRRPRTASSSRGSCAAGCSGWRRRTSSSGSTRSARRRRSPAEAVKAAHGVKLDAAFGPGGAIPDRAAAHGNDQGGST